MLLEVLPLALRLEGVLGEHLRSSNSPQHAPDTLSHGTPSKGLEVSNLQKEWN